MTISGPSGVTSPASVEVGNTLQLTSSESGSTWASSVEATGTVSTSGLFTAVAAGSTNITAAKGGVTSDPFVVNVTEAE